jgi:DNA processing protein
MYPWRFLERNRIISGLADVVIVVEANTKSGSLNTAMHALEQGKDLLAVPGDINRPMSQGCNKLIAQGAMPFTWIEDVLRILFPTGRKEKKQTSLFGDNPDETKLLRAMSEGEREGYILLEKTGLSVTKFNQVITMLEIKGRVKSLGMNRWTLA